MKTWTELMQEQEARERALTNLAAAKVRIKDCLQWRGGEVTFSGVDREALRQMGVED